MSTTAYEARVITLPVERTLTAAAQVGRRRGDRQVAPSGTWTVDDWGRDAALVDAVGRLAASALEHGRRRRRPPARARPAR